MRAYSFLIILIATFSCKPQSQNIIEAESGKIRGMQIVTDSSASGNFYLSLADSGSSVWNVKMTESGYYSVIIRYRAFGSSKEQLLIKNSDTIPIGFAMADTWNEFSQPFYLLKGANTIGLMESWGHIDIDCIMFRKANVVPHISPNKQHFVKEHPRDLVFKLDNYHQSVKRLIINGKSIDYSVSDFPYQESAVWITVPSYEMLKLSSGNYKLNVVLEQNEISCDISINDSTQASGLTIIAPDVEHGASVFMHLPSGRTLLIDTGKEWVRDSIIIPMLGRHGIDTIHTLILTHYHGDHDSGDKGELIKRKFHVEQFYDYNSFSSGYQWNQDSLTIKILNSFKDGDDENTRSLALKFSYKGFVYNHGGDTYARNQKQMLETFPDDIKADVFYSNHHFHGSVLPKYIISTNPDLVILQAQEAVYARSAFMVDYKAKSESVLNKTRKTPVETLFTLEVGAVVIKVKDGDDWHYSTYTNQNTIIVPEFLKIEHK